MNDILSQIIAYAPNKIDTEKKAKGLLLAEVPRSEMDNFNTPDLEQSPDSFLRPGETLEDFDVTFRRPNAQGGMQQLVQPNADGSRPGYAGQEKGTIRKTLTAKEQKIYNNYVKARKDVKMPSITDDQKVKYKSAVRSGKINNNTIKNLKEKFRYENTNQSLRYDTKLKRWEKTAGKDKKNYIQKPNETKSQFLKRVKNIASTAQDVARTKQSKSMSKTRNYIDNWTTNWFDNNLNKYGVKDFDKMTSNLKKDWQKQIKDLKLNTGFKKNLSTPSGLPNVSAATSARSGGDSFKYGNTSFYTSVEKTKTPLSQWRRLFFENKINTTPGFKEKILDYFDFINQDKRGLYRQADGQTIKAYKDILDKNVVYLLSPDSNLIGSSKNQLFNSIDDEFSKAYNSYSNKINKSKQWKESAAKIEKKLGLKSNYIKNSMDKEKKALAKIFDVEQLPEELRYTLEHAQGLSAAAKTGNKEIIERAVNDLIGTTVKQNTALGFGGFEANRNALVRDIIAGVNVEDNLKSLNQLTKNAYQDFGLKGNMYSIKNGQLTSKPVSTALTQKDRFGQYFKEIDKTKEGKIAIKEQAGSLKNLLQELEARGCGLAAGGRILFAEGTPDGKITKCAQKGVAGFIDDLKKGNYSKATVNILKGGGNVLKNILDPKELLKLRNYFGPVALGFMAAFEGGVITDDVIRQGTPLNESLANNWLTKSFLPYTKDYAQAKNLLETGNVPSNMKKYVQDVVTFNEALKDIQGIENRISSRLVDQGGDGMIDGSSMYSQKQQDKEDADVMKKLSGITDYNFLSGSAKDLEYKKMLDEMEATRMAKKEFSPIFGFDKLKDVRTPGSTSFDYMPDETPKDLRPITYMDAEYEDVKTLPSTERKKYEDYFTKKGILQPRQSLSELKYGDSNIYDEVLKDYNKFQRQKEASQYPGYYGTQEPDRFMEGGIASLNVKK